MRKYTWDEISRLSSECGLPSEQIEWIEEDLFTSPAVKGVELKDIAWQLDDMIRVLSYPLFGKGSEEYDSNVRLANLLIRLIELEKPAMASDNEESFKNSVDAFLKDNREVFKSCQVLLAYLLESAAVLFSCNLLRDQSEVSDEYLWLKQIFEKADIYYIVMSYYRDIQRMVSLNVQLSENAFFLRLFLLYGSLILKLENEDTNKKRKKIKNSVIAQILKESLPSGEGSTAGLSDVSSKKDEESTHYLEILDILRENSVYLQDRDIDDLIGMLTKELSGKNAGTGGAVLDILIRQRAKKDPFQTNSLRMRYIDAAVLLSLCREKQKTSEFEIVMPVWGQGGVAFITRKNRRLIMLRTDEDRITVEFRTGSILNRDADGYTGNWSNQELEIASGLCEDQLYDLPTGSSFLFSFIYLKNYRSINEVTVSFDHRFRIEKKQSDVPERSVINISEEVRMLSAPYFYGRHIYSLTCLVGRNGAGKSSVVDFLRESFLAIKDAAEEGKLKCSEGVLEMEDSDNQHYRLIPVMEEREPARFFVIFKVNGKDRYLTNLPRDEFICSGIDGLFPYSPVVGGSRLSDRSDRNSLRKGMNFTEEDCTFAYFSQFHYPTGMYAAQHIGEEAEYRKIISKYVRDLSEENIDRWGTTIDERSLGGKNRFNASLAHQLAYLMSEKKEVDQQEHRAFPSADECTQVDQLKIIVGGTGENTLSIMKILVGSETEQKNGQELSELRVSDKELINIINNEPNAFIGPFSSGQHSRFKLLSRLYWCLAGSSNISEQYKKMWPALCKAIGEYDDGGRTRLAETDTGVLFFDEGDLCYHPEWQRSYLSDIIGMVSALRKKDVQIIVTTNSPFMLSDILREDVFSMAGSGEDTAGLDPNLQTYGQNIHMLLAHRFFMDNTMGKMSEDTLRWLFDFFARYREDQSDKETQKEKMLTEIYDHYQDYFVGFPYREDTFDRESCDQERVRTFLLDLINHVGERVYRVALRNEYWRYFKER